jgi:hypothetical protein
MDPRNPMRPNWRFVNLCRQRRLELLQSIVMDRLLAPPAYRMTATVQARLTEAAARGHISVGSSLHPQAVAPAPLGGVTRPAAPSTRTPTAIAPSKFSV